VVVENYDNRHADLRFEIINRRDGDKSIIITFFLRKLRHYPAVHPIG